MSIGIMLFNPFTGQPRHPSDIESDPQGILVWDGEEPLRANKPAPAQEPVACPTCVSLARSVMMDQVYFDDKPAAYAIHQITDDEGVEEWEDIFTSPDVAREETAAWESVGQGERYEIVPLYRAPPQRKHEQEPVAWITQNGKGELWWDRSVDKDGNDNPDDIPLYTAPPQRQPLTEEEIKKAHLEHYNPYEDPLVSFARAIEAAHGIGGDV